MNKIRILIVGLAAISASSLLSAVAAAPPQPVPAEKVVSFDVIDNLPAFNVAVCDIEYVKLSMSVERDAVNYAVSEPSIAGRSAATHAKVSAHGRMCRQSVAASLRSQPLTYYEQRT